MAKERMVTTSIQPDEILFNIRGGGSFAFQPERASQAVRDRAMFHGFIQRISDAAAGLPNPEDKFKAMQRIADFYAQGGDSWDIARGPSSHDSLILRAVAEVQGATVADMRARAERVAEKKSLTVRAVLARWATLPDVKAAMERLAPQPVVDADELVDELADV